MISIEVNFKNIPQASIAHPTHSDHLNPSLTTINLNINPTNLLNPRTIVTDTYSYIPSKHNSPSHSLLEQYILTPHTQQQLNTKVVPIKSNSIHQSYNNKLNNILPKILPPRTPNNLITLITCTPNYILNKF